MVYVKEKIAVSCPTKELFGKVMKKLGSTRDIDRWNNKKEDTHLEIAPSKDEFDGRKCFAGDGYKIISAQEYLNEDVSDVDQEKLCEYCRDHYDESLSWHCEGVKCEEITEMYLEDNPHIKSKENKMKSNDINKNVAAVFGDVPGNDLLLVDKHFDSDMMERILMDKHKTAILKACKEAEAESVKAEKAKK